MPVIRFFRFTEAFEGVTLLQSKLVLYVVIKHTISMYLDAIAKV